MNAPEQPDYLARQRSRAARSAIALGVLAVLIFAGFIVATMLRGQ